jgi:hypothetical protein
MRHLAIAADRIRRHIVHRAATPSNVNGARDRYVALNAIGRSFRDQYDSLAAPNCVSRGTHPKARRGERLSPAINLYQVLGGFPAPPEKSCVRDDV